MEASRVLSAAELDPGQWAALADAERAVEASWRSGEAPDFRRLLPPSRDPSRVRVLVELVKVDQEFRLKSAQPKPLEVYLEEWEELRASPELVRELLEAECLTRAALAVAPTIEELRARFPEIAASVDLDRIRAAAQSELTAASPLLAAGTWPKSREAGRSQDDPPAPLPLGERFGRYEIRSLLGRGAMGWVYRAYDTRLGCEVALKIPQFDPLREPDVGERFLREAQAAAKSRHPHVCPIYDAGQVGNTLYIAMALIEGQTLAEWMRGRQTESREAAELVGKLARALESVHRAGIVHRDLKPHNVMIDRSGEPILMDFGLAREAGPESTLAAAASIEGAPAYMSPEQVEGRPADARSDVYGLGVVLYQLLCGQLPFSGSLTEVLAAIPACEPAAPRRLRPALDEAIESICMKAMAKNPSDRYQSAEELAEALRAYLESALPAPRPSRRGRKWWVAAAAGGLVVLGVIIMIALVISSTRGQGPGFDVAWSVQGDKVLVGDVNGDVAMRPPRVVSSRCPTTNGRSSGRRKEKALQARWASGESRPPTEPGTGAGECPDRQKNRRLRGAAEPARWSGKTEFEKRPGVAAGANLSQTDPDSLSPIPNLQSLIPNPQSLIPNPSSLISLPSIHLVLAAVAGRGLLFLGLLGHQGVAGQ